MYCPHRATCHVSHYITGRLAMSSSCHLLLATTSTSFSLFRSVTVCSHYNKADSLMWHVGTSTRNKWFPQVKYALAWSGLDEGCKQSRHLDLGLGT